MSVPDERFNLAWYKTEVKRLEDELDALREAQRSLRNELCLKCGRYREAHNGACNGCRWMA